MDFILFRMKWKRESRIGLYENYGERMGCREHNAFFCHKGAKAQRIAKEFLRAPL